MNQTACNELPWYRRIRRWGQVNLTEEDTGLCDPGWWREYWHRTQVQGVILNAAGIVAYYPSSFKLQYRAEGLGNRDLFGEFLSAAREGGLPALARMDINSASKAFYDAHPGWFVVDREGVPPVAGGRYFTCVNSPYYKQYIPQVFREIIGLYKPDGFADNGWAGLSRKVICHCAYCARKFRDECGSDLPNSADWEDPAYAKWIQWGYRCRLENWDYFNKVTQDAGGRDCLWIGMVHADPARASLTLRDLRQIARRTDFLLCDHQFRDALNGFEQNGLNGNLLHGLAGWDKIIPESMANYTGGVRTYRRSGNPPWEARYWMVEGISGGISPWTHHVGAAQEDRRQFENAVPVMAWHRENEQYLYDREPAADIGLVWSQQNIDFYGRDDADEKYTLPWHGFVRALTRARLPYLPVHADDLPGELGNMKLLILPDLAVMSGAQISNVTGFVESGGSLVFTGASATLDELGRARAEFPLEPLTGIRHLNKADGEAKGSSDWDSYSAHNYFRLPNERHPMLAGFEDTDILPFGGRLYRVISDGRLKPLATYIPSFPIYPPEFSWMRESRTDIPAILAGEHPSGGRIVYFAGDVDRCYGRAHLPDHGDLLARAVRWAVREEVPLKVEGPGFLDCKLYRQGRRFILHIVNLSGCDQYPGYVEECLPVGPIIVSVRTSGLAPERARLRVSGLEMKPEIIGPWAVVHIASVAQHEMVVLE